MGQIGCGETQAYITTNCLAGGPTVHLRDAKDIEWSRKLDDISEAKVVVAVTGQADCCTELREIYPWCSYLVITRDGQKVWEGPVTNVIFRTEEVEIEAMDPLAWLLVRIPTVPFNNGFPTGRPAMEITDIAKEILTAAFSEHDPCVLENIVQTDVTLNKRPTPFGPASAADALLEDSASRFLLEAYEGTYFDWLVTLSESGLDFTAMVGRIFLGVDRPGLGVLGSLRDNHIIGDIEVHRDGFNQANRVYARFDEDTDATKCQARCGPDCVQCDSASTTCYTVPCPVSDEADNFFCFGPIERLLSDTGDVNAVTAENTARAFIEGNSVTPTLIDMPEGAQLTPEAPFDINELMPGVQIIVSLTDLCFPVNNVFQLLEVNYHLDENLQEEIRVTLGEVGRTTGT